MQLLFFNPPTVWPALLFEKRRLRQTAGKNVERGKMKKKEKKKKRKEEEEEEQKQDETRPSTGKDTNTSGREVQGGRQARPDDLLQHHHNNATLPHEGRGSVADCCFVYANFR